MRVEITKLTRRKFINFLGFGPVLLSNASSFFKRRFLSKANQDIPSLFDSLVNKKNSIKTISYFVSKKLTYAVPNLKKEIPPMNTQKRVFYSDNKLKIELFFPTEKTPNNFGGKVIYLWNKGYFYKTQYSLDGSFEKITSSRKMTYNEKTNLFTRLEDIFPIPNDKLMTLIGEEDLSGIQTYIILQGNSKYWISPKINSVIKKEDYLDSKTLLSIKEYSNFNIVKNDLYFPSYVIERNFNKAHILEEEYEVELSDIKVNEIIDESVFELNR